MSISKDRIDQMRAKWAAHFVLTMAEVAELLDRVEELRDAIRTHVDNCGRCQNGVIGQYTGLDEADEPVLVPHICRRCGELHAALAKLAVKP